MNTAWYALCAFQFMGSADNAYSFGRVELRLAREYRHDGGRSTLALVLQQPGNSNSDFIQMNKRDRRMFLQWIGRF